MATKLLVIDDEKEMVETIKSIFKTRGFDVVT